MIEKMISGRGIIVMSITLLFNFSLFSQTNPGDIMFVGFNADAGDGFAVVALVEIPANSTYYFTDNEWNGDPIGAGGDFRNYNEGELTWDTGAAPISAGTVILFTGTNNVTNTDYGSDHGSISGTIAVNESNEVLYCYIGTDPFNATGFITAIANRIFSFSRGTLLNTGLVQGETATSITGHEDVMVYDGGTECSGTIEECAEEIADPANWATQDGAGDQSADGIFPDFTGDVPPFFFGSVLPIELESFHIENHNGNQVKISWVTLTEIENDYFTIERSDDGQDWTILEKIQGAGNSLNRLSYSSLDENPLFGTSYYRLKQTDFNGEYEYFDIHSVKVNAPIELRVYPNPVIDRITISAKNIDHQNILFFNSLGHQVMLPLEEISETKCSYLTEDLAPGVYFIRVGLGDSIQASSFVK